MGAEGKGPAGGAALAAYIDAMPKVELHLHMEGAIAPETLFELADRNGVRLPCATAEALRALYAAPDAYPDFDRFGRTLLMGVRCLRRLEDFALVIRRMGAALARQNVRYAEVTWTPQFYLRPDSSPDSSPDRSLAAVLEALNDGRARARAESGVEMRWIVDLVRSVPGPMNIVQRWACGAPARDGGVVALGLGGPEAGFPPEPFEEVFRRARAAGLASNPHAGETAGPDSIWGALKALGAARIGHGMRAVEDARLLRHLAERRIPLEVCPTSNLRLGLYPSYRAHPLKALVEAGCVVTINSDDPELFATTLCAEYRHAVEDCGLTLDRLETAALDAVRASHLPAAEKAAMTKGFAAEYRRLRAASGAAD